MIGESMIVLHGSFGSPYENWFEWLAKEVSSRGVQCVVPWMPTPHGQTFNNWSRIVDAYVETACIGSDSVFVAHSSACAFVLKYIHHKSMRIRKFVSVAGFNGFKSGDDAFDRINSEFYMPDEVLVKAAALVDESVSFFSSSDPYLPLPALRSFAERLQARAIDVPEAGHFNAAAGYLTFPEVLAHIWS